MLDDATVVRVVDRISSVRGHPPSAHPPSAHPPSGIKYGAQCTGLPILSTVLASPPPGSAPCASRAVGCAGAGRSYHATIIIDLWIESAADFTNGALCGRAEASRALIGRECQETIFPRARKSQWVKGYRLQIQLSNRVTDESAAFKPWVQPVTRTGTRCPKVCPPAFSHFSLGSLLQGSAGEQLFSCSYCMSRVPLGR